MNMGRGRHRDRCVARQHEKQMLMCVALRGAEGAGHARRALGRSRFRKKQLEGAGPKLKSEESVLTFLERVLIGPLRAGDAGAASRSHHRRE